MKHKHADLMMMYAEDAMTTERPWELWEIKAPDEVWEPLLCRLTWDTDIEYRRKPRTININGYEVPEPVRERLPTDEVYFYAKASKSNGIDERGWNNCVFDYNLLRSGMIHKTEEAAELHAKALLSFTKIEEGKS